MIRNPFLLILSLVFLSGTTSSEDEQPYIQVLGIAQDAGYPQIGCERACCALYHIGQQKEKYPASLAVLNPNKKEWYLLEATPAIREQIKLFKDSHPDYPTLPEAIFITHAHIGHYAGLMQLGREALGANGIQVYVHDRLREYLANNGPWSQLVDLNNIELVDMDTATNVIMADGIRISSFIVPHRDEFSETVGFKIELGSKHALFIPDIDKWQKWKRSIVDQIEQTEIAFLDATFYSDEELPNRDMSEIPHPFVMESHELFKSMKPEDRAKVHFIHMNHSNPLLWDLGIQAVNKSKGFNRAEQGKNYHIHYQGRD